MGNKVMIIAGELSGDLHGAHLARELWNLKSDLTIYGVGGPRMGSLGIHLLYDSTFWGAIGLTGAFRKAPFLLKVLNKISKRIKDDPPDAIVLIDFGAFNLRLAKKIKELAIPIIYYFPPGAWCPNPERAMGVAKYVSKVAATFPESARVFQEIGAEVEFVGHPLIDIVKPERLPEEVVKDLKLDPRLPVVGLFPGSRVQEVKLLLPTMMKVALEIQRREGPIQYLLPVASRAVKPYICRILKKYPQVSVGLTHGSSYDIMQICKVLVLGAGTATLEAACLGIPMVVLGKVSYIDYLFLLCKEGKRKPEFFALPNMVAGQRIVPEFIQGDIQVNKVVNEVITLLQDASAREEVIKGLSDVVDKIGRPGVVKRVASIVMEFLT